MLRSTAKPHYVFGGYCSALMKRRDSRRERTRERLDNHLSRQQPGKCRRRLARPSLVEQPDENARVQASAREDIAMKKPAPMQFQRIPNFVCELS